jgi:hypothetical protein
LRSSVRASGGTAESTALDVSRTFRATSGVRRAVSRAQVRADVAEALTTRHVAEALTTRHLGGVSNLRGIADRW